MLYYFEGFAVCTLGLCHSFRKQHSRNNRNATELELGRLDAMLPGEQIA